MFGRKKQAAESATDKARSKSLVVGGSKRKLDNQFASVPAMDCRGLSSVKGILKISTHAEALKETYGGGGEKDKGGKENGSENGRNIKFLSIEIREYERALGDNPSCSSGPPIS